jgi:prepilin-type processing-associated H-X9-DG protein/prepilin-type N-terminal cleavage/methylation domain-containing protein
MMKFRSRRKPHLNSFTLVELLVVIGIIALLASLAQPAFMSAINTAQSVKCSENLRSIGSAVILYTTDNNNTLPTINQVATASPPVYPPGTPGFVGVLGSYGISSNVLICPLDVGANAAYLNQTYQNPGSSYEWDPVFDDEPANETAVYIKPGAGTAVARPVTPSRVRLAMDYQSLHHGKANVVYLDGHVSRH